MLVIDDDARLLLLRALRPDDGHTFWLAPGGGLRSGETFVTAARRELAEEVGVAVELGPWVWERRHLHRWRGRVVDQYERFFVGRTSQIKFLPVRPDGYVTGHCWWTLDALRDAVDDFAPRRLRELVAPILRGDYPTEPIDCGI